MDAKDIVLYDEFEEQANSNVIRSLRWVQIVCFLIMLFNELEVFMISKNIIRIGCILSIVLLFLPTACKSLFNKKKSMLKYFIITIVSLVTMIMTISLSYNATLMYVFPLMVVVQYSNNKNANVMYILTIIMIIICTYASYFIGNWDANYIRNFMEYSRQYFWDYSFRISQFTQYTALQIFIEFVIPRCIFITALTPLIFSLPENKKSMLSNQKLLKKNSDHDYLTGLYNRNKLEKKFQDEYSKFDRIGVIFYDINRLKATNDALGHNAGDLVLKKMATSLDTFSGKSIESFRFGSDEFVTIFTHNIDEDMHRFLYNWRLELNRLNKTAGSVYCDVSYGAANGKGEDMMHLIEDASLNMNDMKQRKRRHS